MDSFDWNRSKEELLTESRTALRDIFEGTNYTMIRNPTMGERMNNIYCNGSDKRVAFLIPLRQSQDFTFVFNIEYLPIIQRSGAKLGELKEIKKNKYPNWKQYSHLSYDDVRLILSAFVQYNN